MDHLDTRPPRWDDAAQGGAADGAPRESPEPPGSSWWARLGSGWWRGVGGCRGRGRRRAKVYAIGLSDVDHDGRRRTHVEPFRTRAARSGLRRGPEPHVERRVAEGQRSSSRPRGRAGQLQPGRDRDRRGTGRSQAAQNVTSTIPIVIASIGDPVGTGSSRASPARGATSLGLTRSGRRSSAGTAGAAQGDRARAARVAALWNTSMPAMARENWRDAGCGRALGLRAAVPGGPQRPRTSRRPSRRPRKGG